MVLWGLFQAFPTEGVFLPLKIRSLTLCYPYSISRSWRLLLRMKNASQVELEIALLLQTWGFCWHSTCVSVARTARKQRAAVMRPFAGRCGVKERTGPSDTTPISSRITITRLAPGAVFSDSLLFSPPINNLSMY